MRCPWTRYILVIADMSVMVLSSGHVKKAVTVTAGCPPFFFLFWVTHKTGYEGFLSDTGKKKRRKASTRHSAYFRVALFSYDNVWFLRSLRANVAKKKKRAYDNKKTRPHREKKKREMNPTKKKKRTRRQFSSRQRCRWTILASKSRGVVFIVRSQHISTRALIEKQSVTVGKQTKNKEKDVQFVLRWD